LNAKEFYILLNSIALTFSYTLTPVLVGQEVLHLRRSLFCTNDYSELYDIYAMIM